MEHNKPRPPDIQQALEKFSDQAHKHQTKNDIERAKQAIKQATHDIWFDNLITILTSEPNIGKPDQKYIKDHIRDYLQELTMEGGVAYGIIIALETYLDK